MAYKVMWKAIYNRKQGGGQTKGGRYENYFGKTFATKAAAQAAMTRHQKRYNLNKYYSKQSVQIRKVSSQRRQRRGFDELQIHEPIDFRDGFL